MKVSQVVVGGSTNCKCNQTEILYLAWMFHKLKFSYGYLSIRIYTLLHKLVCHIGCYCTSGRGIFTKCKCSPRVQ